MFYNEDIKILELFKSPLNKQKQTLNTVVKILRYVCQRIDKCRVKLINVSVCRWCSVSSASHFECSETANRKIE